MIPTLKILKLVCWYNRIFIGIPYYWSRNSNHLQLIERKSSLWRWYGIVLVFFLVSLVFFFRLIQVTLWTKVSYQEWFLTFSIGFSLSIASVGNLNFYSHKNSICSIVNELWNMNTSIIRTSRGMSYFQHQITPTIIHMAMGLNCMEIFNLVLGQHNQGQMSIFLNGFLPRSKSWLTLLAAFQFYVSSNQTIILGFMLVLMITYVSSTLESLRFLKENPELMHPTQMLEFYKKLQILNNDFCACSTSLLTPCIFGGSLLCYVVAYYIIIRTANEIPVAITVFLVLSAMFVTYFVSSRVFYTSFKILDESSGVIGKLVLSKQVERIKQTSPKDYKLLIKSLNAVYPIGIKVNSFFVVKRITTLTLIKLAVDNTAMLLLTF